MRPSRSWVALRRKVHFAHNILKFWVCVQGVENMVSSKPKQTVVVMFVSEPLQPSDGLFFVT
jgi:hypothetical protein